jgi:reverse gyrase
MCGAVSQVALKAGKRGDADAFMRHYSEMFSNSMRMESQDNVNKIDNHAPDTDKLVEQVEQAAEEVGKVATANDYDYDGAKLAFEASMKMPLLS